MRQECPLSPLLYVLVSEGLSTRIRKCKEIEGFQLPRVGGLQFKISQYADDATNFVKNERSLCHLLRVVHKYEQGSGAKLNTSKSEAMWLGRWRANGASPFGLNWVSKVKILDVYFSNGLISVEPDIWKARLGKLQSVLNLWKQRELSFLGRAMIVNVLGASRCWYTAKILAPLSGSSIPTTVSFGRLSGKEKWNRSVGSVVARRFVAVASMLSTFVQNVLVFACLVFPAYAIILAVKSGTF